MRMTAPSGCRTEVTRVRPAIAYPMHVVGNSFNIVVSVGIEMLSCLPLVTRALNDMVHVRDHANGNEWMAIIVEIDPPGVARPFREYLELMCCRMIPPYP